MPNSAVSTPGDTNDPIGWSGLTPVADASKDPTTTPPTSAARDSPAARAREGCGEEGGEGGQGGAGEAAHRAASLGVGLG